MDMKCKVVITADGVMRGGKPIELLSIANEVSGPDPRAKSANCL